MRDGRSTCRRDFATFEAMVRAVVYLCTLVTVTVWYGSKVIVAALVGVRQRRGGLYDQAARCWARALLRASGVKVNTVGLENVPTDRPVVYVSNHQSLFDIIALAATLPGTYRFVAKRELAKVPLFGQALRAAGHIYIDRQRRQAAFGAYEKAAAVIKAGTSAVVFGEGTRSRTGNLLPFKKGPFVLAIAAQVPVVPVYCAYTFDILPKGSMLIRPHPISLYFGQSIPTDGMDYEARQGLLAQTRGVIEGFRDDAVERLRTGGDA